MSNILDELLPNGIIELVVNFILILIGFTAKSLYEFIKTYISDRPFRKTWKKITKSDATLYIIFSVVPTENEFGRITKVVTLPLAAALSDLVSTLGKEFPSLKIEMYPSGTFPFTKIGQNLLLVGGPINNETSALIKSKLSLPFEFEGFDLINNHRGEKFSPTMDNNNQVTKDFGSISVFANPFNSHSTICMVSGCFAHGTNAALRSLLKPHVSQLHKVTKSNKQYQVIIETLVASDFISAPQVISNCEISGIELVGESRLTRLAADSERG